MTTSLADRLILVNRLDSRLFIYMELGMEIILNKRLGTHRSVNREMSSIQLVMVIIILKTDLEHNLGLSSSSRFR